MAETLVQRLAKEWCEEAYPSPHIEACTSGALYDARWWLRAIAEVIDANYLASHGNTIAATLRSAAEEDEG